MFKKIKAIRNDLFKRGELYFSIGMDIYSYGKELIVEKIIHKNSNVPAKGNVKSSAGTGLETLNRKFIIPEADDAAEVAKLKSMLDHEPQFNYRRANSEKVNSNMAQRNFENNQRH